MRNYPEGKTILTIRPSVSECARCFGVIRMVAGSWKKAGCPIPKGTLPDIAKWLVNHKVKNLKPDARGWEAFIAGIGEPAAKLYLNAEPIRYSDTEDYGVELDHEELTEDLAEYDAAIEEALADRTIEGRMHRTKLIEDKIFRQSMNNPDPKVLLAYKGICGLSMELEKEALEIARVRDSLIPIDLVCAAASQAVLTVMNEIRALPESAAGRVNPANPHVAKEELEHIIAQLIKSANSQVDSQLRELMKVPQQLAEESK